MATEGNILINGDLVYKEDPTLHPDSDDFAGLVAWESIWVVDNAANQDGCSIHGSLMAVEGSFTVENYEEGSPRGILNIVGGVIQKQRGPVGTFNRYGVVTGYQKKYVYDERLLTESPPAFPVIDRPVLVAWIE